MNINRIIGRGLLPKFMEIFYVYYYLANAIIKQYGLTNKYKKIVERMNTEPCVNDAPYKILKIE